MNEKNDKRTYLCECTSFAFVSGDTVCLDFIWPGPAPKAGQFFLVKPRRTGVFLTRPLSMAGWEPVMYGPANEIDRRFIAERRTRTEIITDTTTHNNRKIERRKNNDRRTEPGGIIRFYVTRRGRGSRELSDLRPGEEAELSGPLGNSWPLGLFPTVHPTVRPAVHATVRPVVHATERHKAKQAGAFALIGGGVGIAPLLPLAAEIKKRPFDFYAGFRTGAYGLENLKPRALIISTEDGSQGVKGRILDFFNISGYIGVFACGPEPMLKELADVCVAGSIPCFVSTERSMACGVGACLGCKVKTTKGDLRCCADGPIFNAEEMYFEG